MNGWMDTIDRSALTDGRTAFQLTWAPPTPADPGEPQKFSFAPNVTPVTFTAPSPADDDDSVPSQSTLFPDPDPSSSSLLTTPSSPIYQPAPKRRRKTASTAPKDAEDDGSVAPEHIPRPPNAFILFRSSFIKSQHVSSSIEGNHGTLSKIVGMVWHNLSFEERQIWQAKAKRALAEHKRRFPEYSFRPSNKDKAIKAVGVSGEVARARDGSAPPSTTTTTTGATTVPAKRKQRECGPRDEARCEHIAALVAKGLKGQSLEDAVKHFDATRAPAVITPRFEQPITALQFEGGAAAAKVQVKDEPREEKIAVQRQQQQAQVKQQQQPLPLHRFRRGSSAPLLDSENTETAARRQSFLMQRSASPLQPSPIRPGAAFLPMPTLSLPSMPSLRAHRKRSASSSPPHRPRMLLPAASLPSIPTAYMQNGDPHAPLSLSLSTTMSGAEMSSYAASAPLSAPALSRQPTLVLDQTQTQASEYYDYDGSQGIWYDGASGSSPNTAAGSEYGYPSTQSWEHPSFVSSISISPQAHATKLKTTLQDFSQFSFTTSSNTPAPMDPSQPESYSPFDTTPASSSTAAVEDYSGMPMLVEPPPLPLPHQHSQSQHQHQHHQQHPLHIQTNWAQAEFEYARSSHSNEHAYYPPPPTSASTLDSASVCDSPVKLSHSSYPHTMAYGGMPDLSAYGTTPAPAPPTSPSSDCTAPHSAHTPRESSSEPSVYAYSAQPHQQHQHEGYASFDDGMGVGVNVNVNVAIDMDSALFQTFYEHSKLSGLAGFAYHTHPDAYLGGMAQPQPQVQHAL